MGKKDVTKELDKSFQKTDEKLKIIQFTGAMDRLKIQEAASYIKQEIHTHNQCLQSHDTDQSTRRMELLQQLADAAVMGDLEKMSQLKYLLDQLQS